MADRDCEHCKKWVYDEETGRPKTSGQTNKRLVPRGHAPPPCRTATKCPKGTPEKPVVLSEKNAAVLRHYEECRAIGRFPEDPIVRRNARILAAIFEARSRRERFRFQTALLQIAAKR